MDDSIAEIEAIHAAAEKKAEGIVPLLARQILESQEGQIELFGMVCAMVSMVAIIRNVEVTSTKIIYTLEDHSGRIKAHYWLEEGYEYKTPNFKLNTYVKVYGTTRTQEGQKTIIVVKMLPVLDPNEVCTHLLEVLTARYRAENYKNKESPVEMSLEFMASQGNANTSNLDAKQQAVLLTIKSNISDEGIGRKELNAKFSHLGDLELNNILNFLISEGYIYSSIDDDHFICTM